MAVIRIAATDEEIGSCFPIMSQLRPHLTGDAFAAAVRRLPGEYRLAYVEVDGRPVAVAGYRITETLSAGRFLHIDDLVTDAASRSKGYGKALLRWLRDHARAMSCGSVQLDTGVQRIDAHRFYEREGMRRSAYHYEIATSSDR